MIDKISISQTLPAITCDYASLESWAHSLTDKYQGLLVTEEQIQAIKKDMAELNKAKDKLNRARIDTVKAVSAPIKEFEAKIKSVCGLFEETYTSLALQVKLFEDAEKEAKRKEIEKVIEAEIAFTLHANPEMKDRIGVAVNPKWLNKTATMASIKEAICGLIADQIKANRELERFEKAQAERKLLIEKAVKAANEKYGVDVPVSRFMFPEFENLEADAVNVLAKIDTQIKALAHDLRQESVPAEDKPVKEEKTPEKANSGASEGNPAKQLMAIRFEAVFTPDKEDEVREVLNKNQFMRIVRQLKGIGVETDFEKITL